MPCCPPRSGAHASVEPQKRALSLLPAEPTEQVGPVRAKCSGHPWFAHIEKMPFLLSEIRSCGACDLACARTPARDTTSLKGPRSKRTPPVPICRGSRRHAIVGHGIPRCGIANTESSDELRPASDSARCERLCGEYDDHAGGRDAATVHEIETKLASAVWVRQGEALGALGALGRAFHGPMASQPCLSGR